MKYYHFHNQPYFPNNQNYQGELHGDSTQVRSRTGYPGRPRHVLPGLRQAQVSRRHVLDHDEK